MNTFYIFNAGCIRRGVDSIRIKNYLKINGWNEVTSPRKAMMMIVATCGVVEKNETSSLKAIKKIMALKPEKSSVIITGCLSKINPDALEKIGRFHYVPNGELDRMDDYVKPAILMKSVSYPDSVKDGGSITDYLVARSFCRKSSLYKRMFDRYFLNSRFLKISVWLGRWIGAVKKRLRLTNKAIITPYYNIKIADGCLNHCTFCATRFATDRLKSRPLEAVLRDFAKGLERGYQIFQLLSEDSGCYGLDIGSSIAELLMKMFEKKGNYKITLIDFGPRWLIEQQESLIPLLSKNQARVKEIFIPLQSGSNKILKRMQREYKIEALIAVLKLLRRKAPGIDIRTSLLVGFPGESEKDFTETLNAIKEVAFAEVTINRYEDRPLALSTKMKDKVPQEIIEKRAQFLVRSMGCNLLS